MGERTHTPGPWRSTLDEFGDYVIQPAGQELAVAAVVNGDARGLLGEASEHAANALLIAAAPDMFEALIQAREWLRGWASAEPQLALVDAALAKARPHV